MILCARATIKLTLKGHRLRRNGDFRYVFARGSSVANRYYVLYVLKKDRTKSTRVGFSVSKKVGNAVVRNRVKRLLREIMRVQIQNFTTGYDLAIIARKEAANLNYAKVSKEILKLLVRAKLL
ncbi:ribonuclease P protein component [Sulfoacidibacillus thermotolerans]|uniref:Ribonuclease P protein component n=1 Tax=Sulfoacidibacillus thermotolerans TaxID=1765684 RepID=A0A2U3D6A9_SULT2|nr:ribonuclease P protein component [Sulfoacidibacillus thermotolerans]PWI56809.1 ribonuclease P protein component [Sulfoacidibacillus thermotolerans]